jgi:hypothetical protein
MIKITFTEEGLEDLKRIISAGLSYDNEKKCLNRNAKSLANYILSINDRNEEAIFNKFYDLKRKQFNIIYGARSNGKEYCKNKYKVFFDECIRKNKEPDDQISIYDFDINGEKESDGK